MNIAIVNFALSLVEIPDDAHHSITVESLFQMPTLLENEPDVDSD